MLAIQVYCCATFIIFRNDPMGTVSPMGTLLCDDVGVVKSDDLTGLQRRERAGGKGWEGEGASSHAACIDKVYRTD